MGKRKIPFPSNPKQIFFSILLYIFYIGETLTIGLNTCELRCCCCCEEPEGPLWLCDGGVEGLACSRGGGGNGRDGGRGSGTTKNINNIIYLVLEK